MNVISPPNRKCEYGCLMAIISPKTSKNIVKFGKTAIPNKNLYIGPPEDELGRDTEPHVTLKFGFTPDLTEPQILSIIKELNKRIIKESLKEMGGKYVIRAGGGSGTRELEDDEFRSSLLSMEENKNKKPTWKIYAEGITIFDSEKEYDVVKFDIKKDPILTEIHSICNRYPSVNKYPSYNPHMTIAYVKKGTFPQRVSQKNIPFSIANLKYSSMDGSKRYYDL